jgi:O-acetyl-ADP-ribose deacetylase (regulator of RNase III)
VPHPPPGLLERIRLVVGDIALLDVEAVVNPANTSLVLGGGVAGSIRRYGGPSIQEECDRLGPIRTGEAVLTGGGRLKARYVIHAAGPVHRGRAEDETLLAAATRNSLLIAREKRIRRLAFPAISTGIYGFPLRRASEIMLGVTLEFLAGSPFPAEVIFCLFDDEALEVFRGTLATLTAPPAGS